MPRSLAARITWSTNAAAVATVAGGVVTAVSAGSAVITATSEGKSGTATITVTPPPPAAVATVVVSPSTASVQVGGTTTLTAETRAARQCGADGTRDHMEHELIGHRDGGERGGDGSERRHRHDHRDE
jgi:uncharacterized protein YjdB